MLGRWGRGTDIPPRLPTVTILYNYEGRGKEGEREGGREGGMEGGRERGREGWRREKPLWKFIN